MELPSRRMAKPSQQAALITRSACGMSPLAKPCRSSQVHTGGVGDVEFSPDGQSLVSTSGDPTARLWDVASGQTVHVFTGHSELVIRVSVFA